MSQQQRTKGGNGWARTRAVLSVGMVLGLGAIGTLAAWSDSATATTGVFSTGSIQLKLNGNNPNYAFTALSKTSVLQGGSVAGMLPVQNTGATNFSYVASMKANGDATLAGNLDVVVYRGGSSDGTTCTGGSQIGTGTLSTATDVPLISSGQTLNAAGTDNLCIKVTVKTAAPIDARMKAASAAFKFTATSV